MGLFSSIGKIAGVAAPFIGHAGWAGAASALGQMYSTKQEQGWKTYLSNTAHQREVADLRAAGLNPILSATNGGSGASVPNMEVKNPAESGIAAKTAAKQLQLQEKEVESRIDLNSAQAEKAKNESAYVYQQAITETVRRDSLAAQTELTKSENEALRYRIENELPRLVEEIEERIALIKNQQLRELTQSIWNIGDLEYKKSLVMIGLGELAVHQQDANTRSMVGSAQADYYSEAAEEKRLGNDLTRQYGAQEYDLGLVQKRVDIVVGLIGGIVGCMSPFKAMLGR